MPQDGIFINKLTVELNQNLINGRIDTIDGINKTDYVFKIRTTGVTNTLYMSVSYNNPTVFLSPVKFEKPQVASSFTMFLRKHLEGGYIKKIYQYNNDRVIMIDIETSNEFDGTVYKTLCLELIGRFSNLLILDENKKIIEAIKQLSVLEDNSRGIMKGLKYEPLINNKFNPFDKEIINKEFNVISNLTKENLVDKISGVSPALAKYLLSEYQTSNQDFYSFFNDKISAFNPIIVDNDYYFFNIFNKEGKTYNTLSNMLYEYYKDKAESKILKDNNQEIFRCVQSNLKRVVKKISKLNEDLIKDKNADELRLKGELLMSIAFNDILKKPIISVFNYYSNENIDIQIDPSKSIKDNSQLYYKKYKKSKAAIDHILRELEIANNEKEYFELLSFQLTKATLKDLIEIKNELISNGYIHTKEKQINKKKQKPNILELSYNGCKIYVGKNNIQNDYITHTLGRKDDLWFHVKDSHGSHVLVTGENKYNEDTIRFAAKYASLYSESKDSSSVPVDYTEIKFIKKVPGTKGSFVTYKKNRTIYIDPKREEKDY